MKEKINLVLAGGGTKGSFHIGVLENLLKKYEVDTVVGTSVGALNSVYIALNKFEELKAIWLDPKIKNKFLKKHTFGVTYGVLFKDSLYSNNGFLEYLDKDINISELMNSKIKWGCVYSNLKSYQKEYVSNTLDHEGRIKSAILASMALIPAFPPVELVGDDGEVTLAIDGGYTEGAPVETCLEIANNNLRTFIILCDNSGLDTSAANNLPTNIFDTFISSMMMSIDTIFDYNIKYGKLKYWDNDKFIVVSPQKVLLGALDFDSDKIKANIELGREQSRDL